MEEIVRIQKTWNIKGWRITVEHPADADQPNVTVEMPLDDFMTAFRTELEADLLEAIGSVTWTLTRAQFEEKLAAAFDTTYMEVKEKVLRAAKWEVRP